MKKIINGKLYNTETAIELGCEDYYDNGLYCSSKTLYKTAKGTYFLCVQYREFPGDNYIEVLSTSEAQKHAEKLCTAETYIQEWGLIEG